jgi:hypothetical protein
MLKTQIHLHTTMHMIVLTEESNQLCRRRKKKCTEVTHSGRRLGGLVGIQIIVLSHVQDTNPPSHNHAYDRPDRVLTRAPAETQPASTIRTIRVEKEAPTEGKGRSVSCQSGVVDRDNNHRQIPMMACKHRVHNAVGKVQNFFTERKVHCNGSVPGSR